jgi:hypothetical protein
MKRTSSVVSPRKPQATSLARTSAFNRLPFLKTYSEILEEHMRLELIYKVYESGISTVHSLPTVFDLKVE